MQRSGGILRLLAHRMSSGALVLIGVSLITFLVFNTLPGNAAVQLLGLNATPEQIAGIEAELGLDAPSWRRYIRWSGQALTGDLGRSFASHQDVLALIRPRLATTLELVAMSVTFATALALLLALLAAYRPRGWLDRLGGVLSMAALSSPNYVVALLLVMIFAVNLSWFPSIGFVPPGESLPGNLRSLVLPAIALGTPLFGLYCRFLRSDLVEQMSGQAYIVTAAAKGIGRWRIVTAHALRNSLFGFLTLLGLHVGTIIGGAVIIEEIFALPGVGKLLLQAVNTRDVPVVQGVVLVLAVIAVMANLVVDLLYMLLDPRLRHAR